MGKQAESSGRGNKLTSSPIYSKQLSTWTCLWLEDDNTLDLFNAMPRAQAQGKRLGAGHWPLAHDFKSCSWPSQVQVLNSRGSQRASLHIGIQFLSNQERFGFMTVQHLFYSQRI